ncbi:MAG TPA: sulfotransferase [Rhodothermales bacterium]|nr:sulfotransferase [Rhodothermales bacterium]
MLDKGRLHMSSPSKGEMPDQVIPFLQKLDDPYGITWRIANVFRRFNLRWFFHFGEGLLRSVHHERPIFIIGLPRSGTTFLFHLLRESNELAILEREGHDIWRLFHHPRYSDWDSDSVGQGEIRFGERRVVNAIFFAFAGTKRFVEKTADNCIRVPYLLELFPDATFVVMKRNPCDVINSYINGWRHPLGRFRSYFVPDVLSIPDYPHRHRWCSTLIDGWRSFASAPIPEIAFAQWREYVQFTVAARSLVPSSQWLELYFEDLLLHPEATTGNLYAKLRLHSEPRLEAKLVDLLSNPVNALTPPGQDKWLHQNAREIKALLPRIAPLALQLGYNIDPATGECEILRDTDVFVS